MPLKVITDSTCDLPAQLVKDLGITVIPLKVLFGEEVYTEGVDITNQEFYSKMEEHKELPKTAQANPSEFVDEFNKHLRNGDEVLGIFISSKLSGTYSSAVIAKDMLNDNRINLIDSEFATFGLGLLVAEAAEMARDGKSAPEIVERIEKVKREMHFYGAINTLENLKKGGRLTTTSAIAGTFLGIKPIITIKNGSVELLSKARGLKKAFTWMLEDAIKNGADLNSKTVYLAHAENPEGLEDLKQMILARFKPQRIIECEIGSVVGTHTGVGCVGFCCLKDD
ncbi:MAG: DegV family protein [Peptococcaceae bacterium]|nr:DegV family protein [Peptococcaceae bacterium]